MRIGFMSTRLPSLNECATNIETAQRDAGKLEKKPRLRMLPDYWSAYKRGRYKREHEVDTGLTAEMLGEVSAILLRAIPPIFTFIRK